MNLPLTPPALHYMVNYKVLQTNHWSKVGWLDAIPEEGRADNVKQLHLKRQTSLWILFNKQILIKGLEAMLVVAIKQNFDDQI